MTVRNSISRFAVLDGFYLKLIAVVTMIIDHIGLTLFPGEMIWRMIGRLSFPIYCFLIVEGFYHTRDIKKYISRLAIFAFISEVPFDLVVNGSIIDISSQNVFFTLLIGLLTIYGMNMTINEFKKSCILVIGMLASIILFTDYTCYGVILIYLFYHMRDSRLFACIIAALMGIVMGRIQMCAAFAMIPIMMYSGRKGPAIADNVVIKYGFYIIYPVHLLLLWLLKA